MTKDSTKPATKKDLQGVKNALQAEIQGEIQKMVTKDELQETVKKLISIMYTKQDHEQFLEDNRKMEYKRMVKMDEIMTEMRDMREEGILFSRQFLRMDDRVDNHEKRIGALGKAA